MLEEVVEWALRVSGRIVTYIAIEIIFDILIMGTGELLIKGVGALFTKMFTTRKFVPGKGLIVIIGLLFWLVVGVSGYLIYSHFLEHA